MTWLIILGIVGLATIVHQLDALNDTLKTESKAIQEALWELQIEVRDHE